MAIESLGSGEVAFSLGSLAVLSFACLLYGNLQRSRNGKSMTGAVTLVLFKGLTWIASIASVLGWLLVLVTQAGLSEFSINPLVIATSATLVASPLIPLLHGLTGQKKNWNNL